jgi:phosphate:Na+ symporter
MDLADVAFTSLRCLLALGPPASTALDDLDLCEQGVAETRRYLNQIKVTAADGELFQRNVAALHILDHLARLIVRGRKEYRLRAVRADQELAELSRELATALTGSVADAGPRAAMHQRLEDVWSQLDRRLEPFRRETIAHAAAGPTSIDETIARLDSMRWLRRMCYHALRIVHHLTPKSPPANEPEPAGRSATGAGAIGQQL